MEGMTVRPQAGPIHARSFRLNVGSAAVESPHMSMHMYR